MHSCANKSQAHGLIKVHGQRPYPMHDAGAVWPLPSLSFLVTSLRIVHCRQRVGIWSRLTNKHTQMRWIWSKSTDIRIKYTVPRGAFDHRFCSRRRGNWFCIGQIPTLCLWGGTWGNTVIGALEEAGLRDWVWYGDIWTWTYTKYPLWD